MSKNLARGSQGRFTALLFTAPALFGLIIFLVIPFVLAFALTFTNQRLISPKPGQFVGLQNYDRLLSVKILVQDPEVGSEQIDAKPQFVRVRDITRKDTKYLGFRPLSDIVVANKKITLLAKDPNFIRSIGNTLQFAMLVVPTQCLCALFLAVLVNIGLKGQTIFRAIYFSPVVMSIVIVSIVWTFLFDKDLGLLNQAISFVSFGHIRPLDWLGNKNTSMVAIAIMSAWQGAGFQMLIFLAGLQGISQELYDAAKIDGANAWQRFWNITIPGLKQTIIFVLTVTSISALGLFTQVDVMTNGGPRGSTATVMFEAVRRGVREENISYGSTIAIVYFVLISSLILLQKYFQSRRAGLVK